MFPILRQWPRSFSSSLFSARGFRVRLSGIRSETVTPSALLIFRSQSSDLRRRPCSKLDSAEGDSPALRASSSWSIPLFRRSSRIFRPTSACNGISPCSRVFPVGRKENVSAIGASYHTEAARKSESERFSVVQLRFRSQRAERPPSREALRRGRRRPQGKRG